MLRLYVPPQRLFLVEETRLPAQVRGGERYCQAVACRASACATSSRHNRAACPSVCSMACLTCSKKGPASISRDSPGDKAGVGAGGGEGSQGHWRGGAT